MYYFLVLVLLIAATIAGCLGGGDDDDDGDEETIININGKDYTVHEIFEDFQKDLITASDNQEYEGVSLEVLLTDAGITDIDEWQYNILAEDKYSKNITYLNLQNGILVKEETMTIFPDLPGKYRVRDVVSIQPVETRTITVNGDLYTWMQPFDIFTTVLKSNATHTLEGVQLSNLLNSTEIVDPQNHNFTISADDGNQKEFTWDDMLNGILVNDVDKKVFFPDIDKKFHIKNVIKIEVV